MIKKFAWEQKMFIGTKNVQGKQKHSWEQKMFIRLASVVHYGIEWPCMALHMWPCMAFFYLLWRHMVLHGLTKPFMVKYRF